MFSNSGTHGAEINMDVPQSPLFTFLHTLIKPPPHPNLYATWPVALSAINLAPKYECETAARTILYAACISGGGEHRIEALGVACRQDNILAASRIILDDAKGESRGKSLRPTSGEWRPADAEQLSARWLWALTCAVDKVGRRLGLDACNGPNEGWKSNEIWAQVLGEWLAHLTNRGLSPHDCTAISPLARFSADDFSMSDDLTTSDA